jgi:uncharacterized membrane protein
MSPTSRGLMALLVASLLLLVAAVELRVVEYAYARIGIAPRALFALLAASVLGGFVNLPVARLHDEPITALRDVQVFGVRYRIPVVERRAGTVVAVNVGGALVPAGVSAYLLATNPGSLLGPLAATAITAAAVHALARPVAGVGIAVPMWTPPLVAAASALLLAPAAPARAAYVGGTIGSLVGADLMNLGRLRGLGAPAVSIGGAGTFDGIFLTGILAALLA